MLCAHVSLLTRSRRPDAACATSERDTKRARRADADYSTSERDAKRARPADADQKNAPTQSELCGLRTRLRRERGHPTRTTRPPNAMPRQRGAPTWTKKIFNPVFLADAFLLCLSSSCVVNILEKGTCFFWKYWEYKGSRGGAVCPLECHWGGILFVGTSIFSVGTSILSVGCVFQRSGFYSCIFRPLQLPLSRIAKCRVNQKVIDGIFRSVAENRRPLGGFGEIEEGVQRE
jgi:hypothetical protein